MREIHVSSIVDAVKKLCMEANYSLEPDMLRAFAGALEKERSPAGRQVLQILQQNAELARTKRIPYCQDTGFVVCFLELGQRSLLAGDMVAGLGTIVVDPPEGDMDDYLASLGKLVALAPRTLFPGHGPAIKNAVPKLREYIEHRLWREQRVLAAWRDGRREPEAMLPAVYDDVPREAWPLAARQILAHLARLRRAGRLGAAAGGDAEA